MEDNAQKYMPTNEILENLFLELFELNEFRIFLCGLTNGTELIDSLPSGTVSRQKFANAAVDAIQKRGILNTDLFKRLIKKRPGQKNKIEKVAQLLNIEFVELDIPNLTLDDSRSVLNQITRQVTRISDESSTFSLCELLEILKFAISLGKPCYNSGDEKQCALIYLHTVQQIIPVLSEIINTPESSMNQRRRTLPDVGLQTSFTGDPMISKSKRSPMDDFGKKPQSFVSGITDKNNIATVLDDLTETLNACPEIDALSAEKVAWRLRYSFNRIFHFVKGLSVVDDAVNSSKSSSSYETEKNIFDAIDYGIAIYGEASDDLERSRAVKTSALMLGYAAKRINDILSSTFCMKICPEDREYIISILSYCRTDVRDDNAYQIVWNARYGLEELLKLR